MAIIDVLLPVKNGVEFLAESIESICNQTFTDWRLIILDHGSTDGSRELAESYQRNDSRIEVYSFPDVVGLAGLLNKGLDLCDCEYVMRHDADDIAYPNRMELSLAAFSNHPEIVVVGGQAVIIDNDGTCVGELSTPIGRDQLTLRCFFENPVAHPTVIIKFSAINELGIRYGIDFLKVLPLQNQLVVNSLAEDYFLFGQLSMLGKCMNLPDRLIKYRRHGGNVGALKFKEQMEASLNISRNLMHSFCAIHHLEYFDPAPFCNHGGILFDVAGRSDFSTEFEKLKSALLSAIGPSVEMDRELAYRKVLSTRKLLTLLGLILVFLRKHRFVASEWYAVKSWLVGYLPGRRRFTVSL